MSVDFGFNMSRYMMNWLQQNKCNILVSSFNTGHVFTISTRNSDPFMYVASLPRCMGMDYNNDKLTLSTMGNIFTYKNLGELDDVDHGHFDINFSPDKGIYNSDVDIHDIVNTDDGKVYYISALFSCICTPSESNEYTFDVYWKPPWISKISAEDRCHLNGLCCINNKPAFVTSVCMSDTTRTWSDNSKEKKGIIYDVVNNEIYCKDLIFPHSPRWHNDSLWLLESGSGYLGYVKDNAFVRKVFIPGFLRGLVFHNNFAIVTTSLDRHFKNFKEYELGKTLEEKNAKEKCGIWIIDIQTFDIVHTMIFTGSVKELYDVKIVPNCNRGRILDINDPKAINIYKVRV